MSFLYLVPVSVHLERVANKMLHETVNALCIYALSLYIYLFCIFG